jgi:hypothetical protein
MPDRRLPIDLKLWALVFGVLFFAMVCVDVAGGFGYVPGSYAINVQNWQAGKHTGWQTVKKVVPISLLYAITSGILSWPIHSFVVIAGIRFGSSTCWLNRRDYQELKDAEIGPNEPWEEHLKRMAALREKGELLRRGRKRDAD